MFFFDTKRLISQTSPSLWMEMTHGNCDPLFCPNYGFSARVIVKKQLHLDLNLYTILQILNVTLFKKTPILGALSIIQPQESEGVACNQLDLFD